MDPWALIACLPERMAPSELVSTWAPRTGQLLLLLDPNQGVLSDCSAQLGVLGVLGVCLLCACTLFDCAVALYWLTYHYCVQYSQRSVGRHMQS